MNNKINFLKMVMFSLFVIVCYSVDSLALERKQLEDCTMDKLEKQVVDVRNAVEMPEHEVLSNDEQELFNGQGVVYIETHYGKWIPVGQAVFNPDGTIYNTDAHIVFYNLDKQGTIVHEKAAKKEVKVVVGNVTLDGIVTSWGHQKDDNTFFFSQDWANITLTNESVKRIPSNINVPERAILSQKEWASGQYTILVVGASNLENCDKTQYKHIKCDYEVNRLGFVDIKCPAGPIRSGGGLYLGDANGKVIKDSNLPLVVGQIVQETTRTEKNRVVSLGFSGRIYTNEQMSIR